MKNKVILNMPVSRKYHIEDIRMMLDIIDVQKENEMFMRNDLFHLTRIVDEIEKKKETTKEEKKEDDSMFG